MWLVSVRIMYFVYHTFMTHLYTTCMCWNFWSPRTGEGSLPVRSVGPAPLWAPDRSQIGPPSMLHFQYRLRILYNFTSKVYMFALCIWSHHFGSPPPCRLLTAVSPSCSYLYIVNHLVYTTFLSLFWHTACVFSGDLGLIRCSLYRGFEKVRVALREMMSTPILGLF